MPPLSPGLPPPPPWSPSPPFSPPSPPSPHHPLHPYALTVDACTKWHGGGYEERCSDEKVHRAGIRCCTEEGRCGGSVCSDGRYGGVRPLSLPPGVADGGATYYQAARECHAQGWRLCEEWELKACCDGSCNYDHHMIWTHTQCFMPPYPPPPPLRPPISPPPSPLPVPPLPVAPPSAPPFPPSAPKVSFVMTILGAAFSFWKLTLLEAATVFSLLLCLRRCRTAVLSASASRAGAAGAIVGGAVGVVVGAFVGAGVGDVMTADSAVGMGVYAGAGVGAGIAATAGMAFGAAHGEGANRCKLANDPFESINADVVTGTAVDPVTAHQVRHQAGPDTADAPGDDRSPDVPLAQTIAEVDVPPAHETTPEDLEEFSAAEVFRGFEWRQVVDAMGDTEEESSCSPLPHSPVVPGSHAVADSRFELANAPTDEGLVTPARLPPSREHVDAARLRAGSAAACGGLSAANRLPAASAASTPSPARSTSEGSSASRRAQHALASSERRERERRARMSIAGDQCASTPTRSDGPREYDWPFMHYTITDK